MIVRSPCFVPFVIVAALVGHCVTAANVSTGNENFLGGYLSFTFVDTGPANTTVYRARISVTTGWVLGHGPCGHQCGLWDVGHATHDERLQAIQLTSDPDVFGKWMTEAELPSQVLDTEITHHVNENITGYVSGVSTSLHWEQEKAHFDLDINKTYKYTDVMVSGPAWIGLDLNNHGSSTSGSAGRRSGNLQIKIFPQIRNDTGRPNSSPVLLFQPVYRIELNKVTVIHLTPLDLDNDLIACRLGQYIEVEGIGILPNATVSKDCRVTVSAMESDGFKAGRKGAVTVVIEDYNPSPIDMEGTVLRSTPKGIRIISANLLQFTVEVVDQMTSPEFVDPTAESQHEFTVYAGAQLDIPVFARPGQDSPPHTDIAKFTVTSFPYLPLAVTPVESDHGRASQGVFTAQVRWQTSDADVGDYVIQLVAVDSSGIESADRSFRVHIKGFTEQVNGRTDDNPYFILFPDDNSISCLQGTTCTFPIFAAAGYAEHRITDIRMVSINVHIDQLTCNGEPPVHSGGHPVYRKDFCIQTQLLGNETLCFMATDDRNLQTERCLGILMYPANPCEAMPCSGRGTVECIPDWDNFSCVCEPGRYSGPLCENWIDPCMSSPCLNNGTCLSRHGLDRHFCRCLPGFTGFDDCATNIDDCLPDSCGSGATCVDEINGFHCLPDRICSVCQDTECLSLNPNVTSCPRGDNLCITTIADMGGRRHVSRGCADETMCNTFHGTQRSECNQVEHEYLPADATCHFCCVEDNCNHPPGLIPNITTLHHQSIIG